MVSIGPKIMLVGFILLLAFRSLEFINKILLKPGRLCLNYPDDAPPHDVVARMSVRSSSQGLGEGYGVCVYLGTLLNYRSFTFRGRPYHTELGVLQCHDSLEQYEDSKLIYSTRVLPGTLEALLCLT